MQEIPKDLPVRINGILYRQEEPIDLKKGDKVLDTKDFTHGEVDMFHDKEHVAVKDGFVAELGVPITRLRKLVIIKP